MVQLVDCRCRATTTSTMLWFRCCNGCRRVATQRVRRSRVIVVCCGLIAAWESIHRQATRLVWEWGDSACWLVETTTWGWIASFYSGHLTTAVLVCLLGWYDWGRKWRSVAGWWDRVNVRPDSIIWTHEVPIHGAWVVWSAVRLRAIHHGASIGV